MNKANNYFEIITGTFVLCCAALFFFTSFNSTQNKTSNNYHLIAKFDNADGISNGSDIKISGVKIGTVESQILDEKTFRAALKLSIPKNIKLPLDSSVKIASEGLLGSKYLSLTPGGDEENLQDGDEIQFTQSTVNFEELLGKFIFNSSEKKGEKSEEK
jgi:phospholipid/cholesterol/gamma-HCH transport system substrate-binding protein